MRLNMNEPKSPLSSCRVEEEVRVSAPSHYVDVITASYLHDTILDITFSDGLTGEVDLMDIFVGPLAEEIIAKGRVRDFVVDEEQGTVVWFNGLDIAPDRLWTNVLERRNSTKRQHQHDWATDIPLMDEDTAAPWEGPYECSCGKSAWLIKGVKTS